MSERVQAQSTLFLGSCISKPKAREGMHGLMRTHCYEQRSKHHEELYAGKILKHIVVLSISSVVNYP